MSGSDFDPVEVAALQPEALADAVHAALAAFASAATLALIGAFAGWLGGELVDRLGVGVAEGAHLNAPNSLSGLPAYQHDVHHRAS